MTAYNRQEFIKWLETLQPDAAFCNEDECPISQYMISHGNPGYTVVRALNDDPVIADVADDLVLAKGSWNDLTPRKLLSTLREQGIIE